MERMRGNLNTQIPILTYHSIDNSGSVISTSRAVFRDQMQFLADSGYQAIALRKLISLLDEGALIDPKTVVLTFDDGFQNFLTDAFPMLSMHNFNATVFLVTGRCDMYNDWPGNPPELPRKSLLSWGNVRELDGAGIEFGSHTRSHPDLLRLNSSDIEAEIRQSRSDIEDNLGREAATFAYPYGAVDSRVRNIVRKNFRAACTTELGKMRPQSDRYSLKRIDTYYLSDPRVFRRISSGFFDRYMDVRQTLRSAKAAFNRHRSFKSA